MELNEFAPTSLPLLISTFKLFALRKSAPLNGFETSTIIDRHVNLLSSKFKLIDFSQYVWIIVLSAAVKGGVDENIFISFTVLVGLDFLKHRPEDSTDESDKLSLYCMTNIVRELSEKKNSSNNRPEICLFAYAIISESNTKGFLSPNPSIDIHFADLSLFESQKILINRCHHKVVFCIICNDAARIKLVLYLGEPYIRLIRPDASVKAYNVVDMSGGNRISFCVTILREEEKFFHKEHKCPICKVILHKLGSVLE
ncbi:hypothetical protein RF11_01595 [Thelohanellus kitauei]|uniref:Uncharacterized protein n=1 Tax=Thelohanellus kitauei TaxID=669202 RepID=A0A0C2JQP2_THEKT|nr:hypothetical protein RF11_01595 [Thelohanellus kitauei]